MDKLKIGDIVKVENYNEKIDNNIIDVSNLEGCIFEIIKIDLKTECPYGLNIGKDDITHFEKSELKLVCKKENRLDLQIEEDV